MIHQNPRLQECIRLCEACHQICLETIEYGLSIGDGHDEGDHLRLLQDCAQICQTSLDFMTRDSNLHGTICGACATVCERCAIDCERMKENHVQLQTCTTTCRSCAYSCQSVAVQSLDEQFRYSLH